MNATAKPPVKKRKRPASQYLFPLAAAYAALILPWSSLALLMGIPAPVGLYSAFGHAHEMLIGYAMLVVAGYLLGPIAAPKVWLLIAVWLLARLGFLCFPGSPLAWSGALAVAGLTAAWTVPRFARSAKKWRNKTTAPLLLILCTLLAFAAQPTWQGQKILVELLLGLALLMFFMGGRIIAPAVAGHLLRQQRTLQARVQPNIEGAVLIILFMVLALYPLPSVFSEQFAGVLVLLCGVLTALRLLRWQLWHCRDRADLLLLGAGYMWLALGLGLLGCALLFKPALLSAGVHALTVGALGTLTLTVMARTQLMQRYRDPNARPLSHLAGVLINCAAVLRVIPALLGQQSNIWLLGATLLWSLSFLLLLVVFWQSRGARQVSA